MKTLILTIFLMLTLAGVGQIIMVSDAENIYKGKQVYQIAMWDSTVTTVYWTVLSGTGQGEGNDGLAFCFGQPKYFEAGIPDTTGVLRVYNPEPIIKRGVYKSWKILVCAVNAETNEIIYRNWEELMFSKLPKYKPPTGDEPEVIEIGPHPLNYQPEPKKNLIQKIFK